MFLLLTAKGKIMSENNGKTVSTKDISVKIEKEVNSKSCNIVRFSEKLVPALKDDRNIEWS